MTNLGILSGYLVLGLAAPQSTNVATARNWIALGLVIVCYKEMGWLSPVRRTYALEQHWITWDHRFLND
jgi:hypothetical protein